MSSELKNLVVPGAYQESRAHLFPSLQSWLWFQRNHRQDLIEAGALRMIAGRYLIHPAKADEVVLGVSATAARKAAAVA